MQYLLRKEKSLFSKIAKEIVISTKVWRHFEENKELEMKIREQHDTIRFLNDKIWDFEEIEKKHDD